MNINRGPGCFRLKATHEVEGLENSVEEVDAWEPISKRPDNSDVQSPGKRSASNPSQTEEVDVWRRVSAEKMRQTLTYRFMRLLEAWVVIGLIAFVVTGNFWLLTTAGLLGLPLQRILEYWFRRPKK